jgi:hypothetical protein
MPTNDPYGFNEAGNTLLEAEVSTSRTAAFEQHYRSATGVDVTPGNPPEYQLQPNKWGAECRIYFNSQVVFDQATALGMHVEGPRPYNNQYSYRINSQELWWELVEQYGFRLGVNQRELRD